MLMGRWTRAAVRPADGPEDSQMGMRPQVDRQKLCCYDEQQRGQWTALCKFRVHGEFRRAPAAKSDYGCELAV